MAGLEMACNYCIWQAEACIYSTKGQSIGAHNGMLDCQKRDISEYTRNSLDSRIPLRRLSIQHSVIATASAHVQHCAAGLRQL